MAYSDDIAEKLFQMFLEQGSRAGSFVLDTGYNTVKSVGSMTRAFLEEYLKNAADKGEIEALKSLTGEVDMLRMNEVIKRLGLSSNTMSVADCDANDFEQLLKQQDILYAKFNMTSDNRKVFVYLNKDSSKVKEAADMLYAMRGMVSEVPPNMYFKNLAPETVRTVDGLDEVETELFRHYARQQGFLYTFIPQENGKNLLVFGKDDAYKARRSLLNVGWDLTGANGALYRKQVEYRLEGHNKIRYAIDEAERELFIVSRDRPDTYVHVTASDYTLYKAGKAITNVDRGHPDFDIRCLAACDSLDNPVVLEAHEFTPDLTAETLQARQTIDIHVPDYDEIAEMHRVSVFADLAVKEGLDNEDNAPWGIGDPSISISEFSGMEFITDTDEREELRDEFERFKNAAWYAKEHYRTDEIKVDQRNLDFIIAKAEAKKRAAGEPVRDGNAKQHFASEKAPRNEK